MNKLKSKLQGNHGNNASTNTTSNYNTTGTNQNQNAFNSSSSLNQDPLLNQHQNLNSAYVQDPLLNQNLNNSGSALNRDPLIAQEVILPVVVENTERVDRVTEVQPVVHRIIEQPQVHHVEQHTYETAPSASGTVQMQPIIQETVIPRQVNEIQEVVHREVPVVQVNRVEEHITENAVLPTIYTKEVITGPTRQYTPAGGSAYIAPTGATFQQGQGLGQGMGQGSFQQGQGLGQGQMGQGNLGSTSSSMNAPISS